MAGSVSEQGPNGRQTGTDDADACFELAPDAEADAAPLRVLDIEASDGGDADDGGGADEGAQEEHAGQHDFALFADVGESPDHGHGEHEDQDVGKKVRDAVAVGVGR